MSAMKHFRVEQKREVLITANSPVDAVRIANHAFDNETRLVEGVWGHPTSQVSITHISAHEEK